MGLAISDPTGTIASPAGVIVRRAGKRPPVAGLVRRAEALEARGFVMGLPLDGNGDETPRSMEARAVAAPSLRSAPGCRSSWWTKRYTTAAALRAIREMGGSTKGREGRRGRAGGDGSAPARADRAGMAMRPTLSASRWARAVAGAPPAAAPAAPPCGHDSARRHDAHRRRLSRQGGRGASPRRSGFTRRCAEGDRGIKAGTY